MFFCAIMVLAAVVAAKPENVQAAVYYGQYNHTIEVTRNVLYYTSVNVRRIKLKEKQNE